MVVLNDSKDLLVETFKETKLTRKAPFHLTATSIPPIIELNVKTMLDESLLDEDGGSGWKME